MSGEDIRGLVEYKSYSALTTKIITKSIAEAGMNRPSHWLKRDVGLQ